tara:strand:+ start:2150 stop:2596 length:447 start_codon:yes stop_codon:yes gene_type:complete
MAVYSPGANNISAFTLANTTSITGTTNISFASLLNILPNAAAPHALSEVRSDGIVYGTIACNTGGSIALTGAYTGTVSAGGSNTVTVFNGSDTSLTLTVTAVYPYSFSSFVDQDSTQITTSNPLTLNASTATSATTVRATFTTTHSTP